MLQGKPKYDQRWFDCLELIKHKITEDEFVQWFKPIVPLEYQDNKLRLGMPDRNHLKHIENKYISTLQHIVYQNYGEETRIIYAIPKSAQNVRSVVTENAATTIASPNNRFSASQSSAHPQQTITDASKIKNPFVIPGLRKMNIDPNLNHNYTVANFIEGDCNRLALSTGLAVASSPGNNPFNPLYIYGNSGLGKTHLVQAIGHKICETRPELQVLYVSMNKFQSQFQTAVKNGELPDFIHFYQTIDVLIIDDIQEITGKTGTQNAFFNIFNHLQMAGKQIILTSDKPPVELKDIEERLLTRFKWGFASQLEQPGYETKYKIIDVKSRNLNRELPNEVIEYLAQNIIANVREIEGALSAIIANAQFLSRKITIPLAREVLKSYVQFNNKEVTVEQIIEAVCRAFDVDVNMISSKKRNREIAQARQIAMYLAKQHTKNSLVAIGAAVGGRNHSTVLHSCKAVANMIETDKQMKATIERIVKEILS